MPDLNSLSESLLTTIKLRKDHGGLVDDLLNLPAGSLRELKTNEQKKSFWINIYNGFCQLLAEKNPSIGKQIFKEKQIRIAQVVLSLDDIEHGILRLGKSRHSLGFWKSFWRFKHLKALRPSKLDYRIHFALNCGAKSCPPIKHYTVTEIDNQLDLSTLGFLESETIINSKENRVSISRLFLWFYNDFGGRGGTLDILTHYLKQDFKNYRINYRAYNWDQKLRAFA